MAIELTYTSESLIEVVSETEFAANCNFADQRQLSWDVLANEPILYTFRVESECSDDWPCYPSTDQNCTISTFGQTSSGQAVVLNVVARDVSDVCRQLSNRGFDFVIKSIKKFSRPFDRGQRELLEAAGFDFTCNTLEEIALDSIECSEFIITDGEDFDFVTPMTVQAFGGSVFAYTSESEIEVTSESSFAVGGGSAYSYTSTAEVIVSSESAIGSNYDFGVLEASGTLNASLISLQAKFVATEGATLVGAANNNVVVDCDCDPLPSILEVRHDIVRGSNPLQYFLTRNSFTLPEIASVNFVEGTWRNTYSFSGLSNKGETENWSVGLEWSCTDQQSAYDLDGSYYWRFAFNFKQAIESGFDKETRIIINFASSGVCLSNAPESLLTLKFDVNVLNKTVNVRNNTSAIPETVIIKDDIGLFKTKQWNEFPNLNINVTQLDTEDSLPRLDIRPLFPSSNQPNLVAQSETGALSRV